jgi:hypothetical protein
MRIHINYRETDYPWRKATMRDTWVWIEEPDKLTVTQRDKLIGEMNQSEADFGHDIHQALKRLYPCLDRDVLNCVVDAAVEEMMTQLEELDRASRVIKGILEED